MANNSFFSTANQSSNKEDIDKIVNKLYEIADKYKYYANAIKIVQPKLYELNTQDDQFLQYTLGALFTSMIMSGQYTTDMMVVMNTLRDRGIPVALPSLAEAVGQGVLQKVLPVEDRHIAIFNELKKVYPTTYELQKLEAGPIETRIINRTGFSIDGHTYSLNDPKAVDKMTPKQRKFFWSVCTDAAKDSDLYRAFQNEPSKNSRP